jgi:hypothetical protein
MGLFWMTSPIAWLYAIPVERFCDALTAAKLNLTLLGVVSLWRVLLMARVIQHLTRARFPAALAWVTFAALLEVLGLYFFGGGFAKAIVAGMGGMRNSPAEDLMLHTMGTVFVVAFWTTPWAFVFAVGLLRWESSDPLPRPGSGPWPGRGLLLATLFWMGVAVYPQCELARNYRVEKLLAADKPLEALNYLSAHGRKDFAPARVLPPKPFEYSVFRELPACFGVVQPTHAGWVRQFLVERLNEMIVHFQPRWRGAEAKSHEEQLEEMKKGIEWRIQGTGDRERLWEGLQRIPEGQAWLATNRVFREAMGGGARESGNQ